jgi:hypothetical protein
VPSDGCRHIKGEDVNYLQPKELISIEKALQNGQTNLDVGDALLQRCSFVLFWNMIVSDVGDALMLQRKHWRFRRTNVCALDWSLCFVFFSNQWSFKNLFAKDDHFPL